MTTQQQRRDLFWWGGRLGLLAVVIAMGVSAWHAFRPATGIEKRMVGAWRSTWTDSDGHKHVGFFTLTAGRRQLVEGAKSDRKWYIKDNALYFTGPWYEEVAGSLLENNSRVAFELTFENDDSIQVDLPVNGQRFHWQRVPQPAR